MLENSRVTAFTISELLSENQQGENQVKPPAKLGLQSFNSIKIRLFFF